MEDMKPETLTQLEALDDEIHNAIKAATDELIHDKSQTLIEAVEAMAMVSDILCQKHIATITAMSVSLLEQPAVPVRMVKNLIIEQVTQFNVQFFEQLRELCDDSSIDYPFDGHVEISDAVKH